MPRKCTICFHKDHKAIDSALSDNVEYGQIRAKYDVSHKAIAAHLKNHLQPILAKANAIAEQKIVNKLVKYREEVNYSPLIKTKMVQSKLIEELDSAEDLQDRISIVRELRGWFQEENKLSGNYVTEKENPANVTPEQQANRYYNKLVKLNVAPDRAVEITRERKNIPNFTPEKDYIN